MPFPIRVQDVMSSPVRTATAEATAADAAQQCYEQDINSLVVVENGNMVGIVTGTDLLGVLGSASEPKTVPLGDVMSSPVATTAPETPVGDAMAVMHGRDVARLVAVDDGKLVGLVSTDDIVRYVPQVFHRQELDSTPQEEPRYRVSQETAYEKSDWEFESTGISDDEVDVGDCVEFTKTISEQDVRTFAAASGDTNRLHLDEEYAEDTRFGRRIVHGTLVSGLISAALARLPGLTIYLSQDLSFRAPADVGERVTAVCEIVGSIDHHKYELTTDVFGADGETVIEGQATVLVDELPETAHVEVEAIP
ncbi:MAG: CBS domain-containing protein [Halovenus sp.]